MEGPPSHLSADLTTPDLRKALTPRGSEDADTAVIAVTLTLVFLTLLTALSVIGLYLYRNRGSYLTYERPEPGPGPGLEPGQEPPGKDKEEYFI